MLPCAHKKVLATTVALKLVGNAASGMLRVLSGLRVSYCTFYTLLASQLRPQIL
jgi:hypothetical protein